MKNPGRFIKSGDGRFFVIFNNQPLLQEKQKMILNLADEKGGLILDEKGKPKIILKDVEVYNLERTWYKLKGYVD